MHFYWEGKDFSYLHYLSVKSFVDCNPSWECIVHTNKEGVDSSNIPWRTGEQSKHYKGKNYFPKLKELDVTVREFDFPSIGVSPLMHPVQKSDLLRWHLLSTEGGGWSDADIIYTKPISVLESQMKLGMDCCICIADTPYKHHVIGFYLASKGNKFFADILARAYSPDAQDYQMFGNKILNKYYPTMEHVRGTFPDLIIENLNREVLYSYQWFETSLLFEGLSNKHEQEHIIGVHWYNGAEDARDFINNFEDTSQGNRGKTTIMNLVEEVSIP